jgi:uncharacterized protein (UPF0332 family)
VNSDVADLFEKARRSLEVARLLHQEGHNDFSVSRAYYTMFYVAEALLLLRGLSFSSHSAVCAAYGREYARSGLLPAQYHRMLLNAERMRNIGDYDAETMLTSVEASEVIKWAEAFLDAAQQYVASLRNV